MEVWKDAVGFEGYLQVSTEGRCKSVGRWIKDIYGDPRWKPETIIAKDGKAKYKNVSATVNGVKKSCALYRLVAMTFIPNPENKPVVNHIDGNTRNNAVSNLEWCTYSENTQHAIRTGLLDPKKIQETIAKKRKEANENFKRATSPLGLLLERKKELMEELAEVREKILEEEKKLWWRT